MDLLLKSIAYIFQFGLDKDASIARFFNGDKRRMKPVEEGKMIFNSVAIEYDKTATTASKTYRIDQEIYI